MVSSDSNCVQLGSVPNCYQPNYSPTTPIDPRVEMFQKGQPMDAFFNMKALAPRPMSTATEMFDTDFEDSDEEEGNSPRLSVNSVSRHNCFCSACADVIKEWETK